MQNDPVLQAMADMNRMTGLDQAMNTTPAESADAFSHEELLPYLYLAMAGSY